MFDMGVSQAGAMTRGQEITREGNYHRLRSTETILSCQEQGDSIPYSAVELALCLYSTSDIYRYLDGMTRSSRNRQTIKTAGQNSNLSSPKSAVLGPAQ